MTIQTIEHLLSDYLRVMTNQQLSRCKITSMIEAKDPGSDYDLLWTEHERLRNDFRRIYRENKNIIRDMVEFGNNLEGNNNLDGNNLDKSKNNRIQRGLLNRDPAQGTVKKPPFSFLDLKIKIATRMFQHCNFCEKACGVDRRFEKGECGVDGSHISSEFLHVGEEPPLVPSHTIFFSGCNFNCVYCQNWDISQNPDRGIRLSEKDLALIIENRRRQGSRNVNFVGGDPTPNLHYILGTMQLVRDNIPLVWNSNLYLSTEAMQLLDGFVDLYLTDFKYGNDECAQRLSNIPSYMEVVGRNHRMAFHAGDIIIRHLVLPNHVECCSKPLLEWISKNLGLKPVLNIMGQYHPVYKAQDHVEISGLPSSSEISEVIHYAHDLGFNNLV